ncbi:hypothetical protein [Sphingomonas pokkalii]|uniref:hypothetical protein n=1 Tax=Sphingomonas pokkalii TaxID=2175090 RepID=UPI001057DC2D|nr:hypothetical protein [Sphingomonas pokkalii]
MVPLSSPLLLLMLGAAGQDARMLNPEYTVTNVGGGLGVFVDEKVIIGRVPQGAGSARWLAERIRRDRNWCGAKDASGKCAAADTQVHDWIDSARCKALTTAMTTLWDLPPVRFLPPGETMFVSDSATVTVRSNTRQAGYGTPLSISQEEGDYARWWHAASNSLKPCWQASPPLVEGQPLAARLSSPTSAPQ